MNIEDLVDRYVQSWTRYFMTNNKKFLEEWDAIRSELESTENLRDFCKMGREKYGVRFKKIVNSTYGIVCPSFTNKDSKVSRKIHSINLSRKDTIDEIDN